MPKLKIVSAKRLLRFLGKRGFFVTRQTGSHVILRKEGLNAILSVPLHFGKDLGRGLISSLLKTAKIDPDDYQQNV